MKLLHLLHAMLANAFYSWALAEIDPLHPDVPAIVRRRRELQDKMERIFS